MLETYTGNYGSGGDDGNYVVITVTITDSDSDSHRNQTLLFT
jgi:hypothetical protein